MNVWFFIVVVIAVLYALNRLTSTTDLPVSFRLAEAREIVERGRRQRSAAGGVRTEQTDAAEPAGKPDQAAPVEPLVPAGRVASRAVERRYCASPLGHRTASRSRHTVRH